MGRDGEKGYLDPSFLTFPPFGRCPHPLVLVPWACWSVCVGAYVSDVGEKVWLDEEGKYV